ncbi:MAG: helix-turn-helix transcriptional regulator [Gammaproteobacteria bacterium]|nr:helix-turn-helix transcriptional regulator [Gammaproteobacteria bacterium]
MVEHETGAPEPSQEKFPLTAGKKLSEARIAYGLSVEEVAENLNLSIHSVEALERDDYESLPGYTFAKGYLRSYAALLHLDPKDILASVELVPEELLDIASPKSMAKSGSRRGAIHKKRPRGRVFKRIVLAVVFVALVLVGIDQFSKLDIDQVLQNLDLSTFTDLVN